MILNGTTFGGANPAINCGTDGALSNSEQHGRYMRAVLVGNVYIGANPAGTPVTTQAGLSATTPAFTLYNPVGSGVNLVLYTFTVTATTAPAAITAFAYALNLPTAAAPTSTTAANVINANGQTSIGKGQAYRVATLAAAPVAYRYPFNISAASLVAAYSVVDDIAGAIILTPGVCFSIQTLAAAAILCSCTWEEVPTTYA